jgi:hypothetical protein
MTCLDLLFNEIEGFEPKTLHQIVQYTNNPSGASQGHFLAKKRAEKSNALPFLFY